MTFDRLTSASECKCLENNCFEDTQSHWGIKTNKNFLRDVDFHSKHEKQQSGDEPINDCEKLCSLMGKSMSVVKNTTQDHKDVILALYKELFQSSPKYKPFLSIVKFKEGLGLIKATPLENNIYHHDFYRCDTFAHTEVELIESIPLAENV